MKKHLLVWILLVAGLCATMPAKATTVKEEIDGILYELSDDGGFHVATVLPKDYPDQYSGYIVIPESVEYMFETYDVQEIADEAFFNNKGVTFVEIGGNVGKIGYNAFAGCEALISVTVPSFVSTMGDHVFASCTNLESVDFKANVGVLPEGTFRDCIKLSKFKFNSGNLVEIGPYAFQRCVSLSAIDIPAEITTIGQGAFFSCQNLATVTLHDGLTTIGDDAFANSHLLEKISIPQTVTSIGSALVENCPSLDSILVDEGNTAYCSVDGVLFNKAQTSILAYPGGREGGYTIPNGITTVGHSAFSECGKLTAVSIPASVATLEDRAFYKCSGLETIVSFRYMPPVVEGSALSGMSYETCQLLVPRMSSENYKGATQWSWFDANTKENVEALIDGINYDLYIISEGTATVKALPGTDKYSGNIVIPEKVEKFAAQFRVKAVANDAFKDCSGVTSVTLPEMIETIGDNAFAGCSGIKEIDLHNISELGLCAFEGCSALESVEIPGSIPHLGAATFKGCSSLKSVVIPDFAAVNDEAFSGCTSLQLIICNATSVLLLGVDVFKDVNPETLVLVPFADPDDYLADGEWSYFSNIHGHYFDQVIDGINYNLDAAFNRAKVVPLPGDEKYSGNITIPANVEYLGLGFEVKELAEKAFYKNDELISVVISEGVETLNGEVFEDCDALVSVTLPTTVSFFDGYQFANCDNLKHVNIPEGITAIHEQMFADCSSLDSIVLPASLTDIHDGAFKNCGLSYLYCKATTPPVWSAADCFENVPHAILVRVPDGTINDYYNDPNDPGWAYFNVYTGSHHEEKINGVLYSLDLDEHTATVTAVSYPDVYTGDIVLPTSVSFRDAPYAVTEIDANAFAFCAGLTSVTLPEGLTTIGDGAFKGATALDTIVLPSTVTSVGVDAFKDCTGLELILSFAENVPETGVGAFDGVSGTAYIIVPDLAEYLTNPQWNVFAYLYEYFETTIGAFRYRLFLKTKEAEVRYLPDGGKYIGDIVVPAQVAWLGKTFAVTAIGDYTFAPGYGHSKDITSVTLPEGLKVIDDGAFLACALTSVTLPESLTIIGQAAFEATGLSEITIPANVSVIKDEAFYDCVNLKAFNVVEANEYYCSVDGVLFSKDKTDLHAFPTAKGPKYVVPEGTTFIAFRAFSGLKKLKHVTLPASLTNIDMRGFYNTDPIDTVVSLATTPPVTGPDAFTGMNDEALVIVPFEAIGDYQNEAGWKYFKNITAKELLVSGIGFANIHATTVDVSWEGFADSYELRWKKTADGEEGWVYSAAQTGKAYTIEGLTADTQYELQIRPTYGGTKGKWADSEYFYSAHLFTLTYEVDSEVYATEKHEQGDAIVLMSNPVKEGYTFSGWKSVIEVMPDEDWHISGYFSINIYSVRFYGLEQLIEEQLVEWNTAAVEPKAEDVQVEGYTFLGWDITEFSHVTSDMEIHAQYQLTDFELKLVQELGTITVTNLAEEPIENLRALHMDTVLLLTATPKEGYRFVRWETNGFDDRLSSTTDNPAVLTMPIGDVTVLAVFEIATGIESANSQVRPATANSQKLLIDGHLYILRGNEMYAPDGRLVK